MISPSGCVRRDHDRDPWGGCGCSRCRSVQEEVGDGTEDDGWAVGVGMLGSGGPCLCAYAVLRLPAEPGGYDAQPSQCLEIEETVAVAAVAGTISVSLLRPMPAALIVGRTFDAFANVITFEVCVCV